MKSVVAVLFLYASLVKLAPVLGLLRPTLIPEAYGVAVGDPNLLILLQHRAALFAIVGGLLAVAAFRESMRAVATIAGLFSMASFIAIVWLHGTANDLLIRYATIDVTAAIALSCGYIIDRRHRMSAVA